MIETKDPVVKLEFFKVIYEQNFVCTQLITCLLPVGEIRTFLFITFVP